MRWILVAVSISMPTAWAQDPGDPAPVAVDGAWESTLEQVIPAVVAIRVTGVRDFDTEDARDTVGTGFVVDAEQGLILTNRHMVHAGPVIAEAVFLDHEEVELQAIYRDPVHDFGVYRFDPDDVRYMEVTALPLAPEAAAVGREIRIVGNDAGEKISILAGTLARLDRDAPAYGGNTYNDFNTFYYQAASGTSGGSSGSPVVDIEGRAIALNAGGRRDAASSFYLPLDRVVRALDRIRAAEPVPRGTIQTVWRYQPYDEVKRLGLSAEAEQRMRAEFPEATGLLVVDEAVPGGPAAGSLEPGDILLEVDGAQVNGFLPLEAALDDRAGGELTLRVERGGEGIEVTLPVQDLHAITPDEYLEVGRAVLNPLSYQQARNHTIPVEGVYVAVAGYMLGRAGVPTGAIIAAIDGEPTPDLDALEAALARRAHGERMVLRYHTVTDPRRDHVVVTTMDRLWYPMQRCRRDDATGYWPCTPSAEPPPASPSPEYETLPLTSTNKVGRKLAASLVMVEFDVPHPTAGVKAFNYVGNGVVVDAERGWVLVDRDTVPVALGDIDIVFAGSLRVPGRLRYLHPVHNLALLEYDPALLGDTPVEAVSFRDRPLSAGDRIYQVGLDSGFRVVTQQTRVEHVEPLDLGISRTPRYRDYNVEGVSITTAEPSLGGVLVDRGGRVLAVWASFVDQAEDERYFYGLPTAFVPPWMRGEGEPRDYCAAGMELRRISLSDAQERGLAVARTKALVDHDPIDRSVLEVERVMGGSEAQAGGLMSGDVLLEARVDGIPRLVTGLGELETLDQDLCGEATGTLTVLRDRTELILPFDVTRLDGDGTDRAVTWAGLILHEPHIEVATQEGMATDGVYVAWMWFGSPAARYGLRPTRRIVEVDGVPTPDLDTFLEAVAGQRDRQAVRIKMVTLDGQVQVHTLKLDLHYWPLTELVRQEDGTWTRR